MSALQASLRAAALTVAVRAGGAGKEILVAALFGTGPAIDAFVGGSSLVMLAVNVLASSLSLALVPRIARLRQDGGEDAANDLTRRFLGTVVGALALLAGALWILAPSAIALLYPDFGPEKRRGAIEVLRVLLPVLPLTGFSAVWGAVLTMRKRVGVVALAPLMTPLVVIGLVLSLGAGRGVFPLAIGTLGGALLEAILLGSALRATGHPLLPRWAWRLDEETRKVLRQYAPLITGALLTGSSLLVDQIMISTLGSGNLSALSYGTRITSVALSVISTGLALVLLPTFSDHVARREWATLRSQYSTICRRLVLVSLPVTIALSLFSSEIVRLLFERGAFRAADTLAVGRIQAMHALQIPFFLVGIITSRLLSAFSANHLLMAISGLNLLVNAAGNYAFRAWLGAPGIALSSSLVQLVSCVVLVAIARRLLRREDSAALAPAPAPTDIQLS